MRLNKGLFSFEDEAVNIPLHFVENSGSAIEFMLNVIPHGSPEEWLVKQQLIRDNKPSVAAALLFADEPQIAVRYANVKIYYYNTLADEGTRETLEVGPITIEGNLYNQIYNSVEQTINVVEEIPILAENGLEKINYPKDTIHEIITNAIIHRDYSINDSVHIRIFNNRIEIVSPGTLPAHVTERNFLKT